MGGVTRCCCCAVVLLVHHVLRLKILSELRRGRIAHSTVKFDLGRIRILLLQVVLVNVMSSTAAQNFLLSFPLIIKVVFERTMSMKGLEIVGNLTKKVRHGISGLVLLLVVGGTRIWRHALQDLTTHQDGGVGGGMCFINVGGAEDVCDTAQDRMAGRAGFDDAFRGLGTMLAPVAHPRFTQDDATEAAFLVVPGPVDVRAVFGQTEGVGRCAQRDDEEI